MNQDIRWVLAGDVVKALKADAFYKDVENCKCIIQELLEDFGAEMYVKKGDIIYNDGFGKYKIVWDNYDLSALNNKIIKAEGDIAYQTPVLDSIPSIDSNSDFLGDSVADAIEEMFKIKSKTNHHENMFFLLLYDVDIIKEYLNIKNKNVHEFSRFDFYFLKVNEIVLRNIFSNRNLPLPDYYFAGEEKSTKSLKERIASNRFSYKFNLSVVRNILAASEVQSEPIKTNKMISHNELTLIDEGEFLKFILNDKHVALKKTTSVEQLAYIITNKGKRVSVLDVSSCYDGVHTGFISDNKMYSETGEHSYGSNKSQLIYDKKYLRSLKSDMDRKKEAYELAKESNDPERVCTTKEEWNISRKNYNDANIKLSREAEFDNKDIEGDPKKNIKRCLKRIKEKAPQEIYDHMNKFLKIDSGYFLYDPEINK